MACRVGIQLPTVEVRYEHLTVEAECYIGNRALPTLVNQARNIAESALGMLGIRLAKRTNLTILKDASGIIHPSRFFFFFSIFCRANLIDLWTIDMSITARCSIIVIQDDTSTGTTILGKDYPFTSFGRQTRSNIEGWLSIITHAYKN